MSSEDTLRCPCGGIARRFGPHRCPACGEEWVDRAAGEALDAWSKPARERAEAAEAALARERELRRVAEQRAALAEEALRHTRREMAARAEEAHTCPDCKSLPPHKMCWEDASGMNRWRDEP